MIRNNRREVANSPTTATKNSAINNNLHSQEECSKKVKELQMPRQIWTFLIAAFAFTFGTLFGATFVAKDEVPLEQLSRDADKNQMLAETHMQEQQLEMEMFSRREQIQENILITPAEGWHPVHVYSGGIDLLLDRENYTRQFSLNTLRWSGQIQQDALVYELLGSKKNGYFVELAANDAVYLSNSFALEQYFGWNGICVEGNPVYWYWLAFRRCVVAGAMAGAKKGETLHVNFDGAETGGIVGHNSVKGKAGVDKKEARRTTTLLEILQQFKAPARIDYLNLDVEGAETYIMQGFDFNKYTFSIMTIERPDGNLVTLLKQNGYEQMMTLAGFGETLWKHNTTKLVNNATGILSNWCQYINPQSCSDTSGNEWPNENTKELT